MSEINSNFCLSKIANISHSIVFDVPLREFPLELMTIVLKSIRLLPDGGKSLTICAFVFI